MPYVLDMVRQVKALGMETCMTLGMLDDRQAKDLAEAGLDYYNHNLDTSPEYYGQVITTRTYNDRLSTLANVRDAGMKVCCGGIVGMGENRDDRVGLLQQLANLPHHPESVPINMLVKIEGTPLADVADLDPFEFVRTIAVARILMPESYVRLSAGRQEMHDEAQALCFLAGANSIFYGERLLTTDNPEATHDRLLFDRLGIHPWTRATRPPTRPTRKRCANRWRNGTRKAGVCSTMPWKAARKNAPPSTCSTRTPAARPTGPWTPDPGATPWASICARAWMNGTPGTAIATLASRTGPVAVSPGWRGAST